MLKSVKINLTKSGPKRAQFGKNLERIRLTVKDLTGLSRVLKPGQALNYYRQFVRNLPEVIGTRSLAPVDLQSGSGPFELRARTGKPLQVRGQQVLGLVREIWVRKVYTGDNFLKLEPESLIVDLGANVGVFTLFALAHTKARVIAVEAQGNLVNALKANLALNHCEERVKVFHGVIGPQSGIITTMRDQPDVPQMSYQLRGILADSGITSIDFLKIDIEGSEFDLFADEPDLLTYTRQIAVEVHYRYGRLETIRQACENNGFECKVAKLTSPDMCILYARKTG